MRLHNAAIAFALTLGLVVGCSSQEDEGSESSDQHLESSDNETHRSGDKGETPAGDKCHGSDQCPKGQVCRNFFCEYIDDDK